MAFENVISWLPPHVVLDIYGRSHFVLPTAWRFELHARLHSCPQSSRTALAEQGVARFLANHALRSDNQRRLLFPGKRAPTTSFHQQAVSFRATGKLLKHFGSNQQPSLLRGLYRAHRGGSCTAHARACLKNNFAKFANSCADLASSSPAISESRAVLRGSKFSSIQSHSVAISAKYLPRRASILSTIAMNLCLCAGTHPCTDEEETLKLLVQKYSMKLACPTSIYLTV